MSASTKARSRLKSCYKYFYRDVGNNYVYPSLNQAEDALSKRANISLVEFAKTEVKFHLDTLEKHYLSQRKFLCSTAAPTLADSWTVMVLSLLELVSFDFTQWPKTKAWMCSMKSRSDYVDVSYGHEEMVRKCVLLEERCPRSNEDLSRRLVREKTVLYVLRRLP